MTKGENITDARHFALAEGYAWGRQDERVIGAGVGVERDTEAATAFAVAFMAHRRAFLDGKLGMAHNVASAYDMFVRGETLPTTAEYAAALRRAAPELSDSFGHRINPVG